MSLERWADELTAARRLHSESIFAKIGAPQVLSEFDSATVHYLLIEDLGSRSLQDYLLGLEELLVRHPCDARAVLLELEMQLRNLGGHKGKITSEVKKQLEQ